MRKRIGGLILAAGCSKRMGDFKPLMPLRGKTLIENTIDSMLLCGISPITPSCSAIVDGTSKPSSRAAISEPA